MYTIMFVCQEHFAKKDIEHSKLLKSSLPRNSRAGNFSSEAVGHLNITASDKIGVCVAGCNIDEEIENAMTVMPVGRSYGKKDLRRVSTIQ